MILCQVNYDFAFCLLFCAPLNKERNRICSFIICTYMCNCCYTYLLRSISFIGALNEEAASMVSRRSRRKD
uniref:Uncharacterized protein n=1 Tax=Lepeophtheirus salmonis TaxID=72036 RepID=A0A0K2UMF7_LEPSM